LCLHRLQHGSLLKIIKKTLPVKLIVVSLPQRAEQIVEPDEETLHAVLIAEKVEEDNET
jgi:hypothetical protein